MKVNPTSELEGSREEFAAPAENAPATGLMAGIDRPLDGGRIDRLAVGACSIIANVKDLSHGLFSLFASCHGRRFNCARSSKP
jgi:hypothetical protein